MSETATEQMEATEAIDAQTNDAVTFDDDGLVEFRIMGKSYMLDPIADLDEINGRISDLFVEGKIPKEKQTEFLKAITAWFSDSHGARIGIGLANTLYVKLCDERERLFDFFGWTRNSSSTSDSMPADTAEPKSEDDSQTCQDC